MTDREQQLIMQDLCARLPYGVKVSTLGGSCKLLISVDIKHGFVYLDNGDYVAGEYSIDDIKPYLCPMSSMTEEEKQQIRDFWICADTKEFAIRLLDFYNQNHLDYRGLIPMGLAIEVTKENNPYKN